MFFSRIRRRLALAITALLIIGSLAIGTFIVNPPFLPTASAQSVQGQTADIEPWDIHLDINMYCQHYTASFCPQTSGNA